MIITHKAAVHQRLCSLAQSRDKQLPQLQLECSTPETASTSPDLMKGYSASAQTDAGGARPVGHDSQPLPGSCLSCCGGIPPDLAEVRILGGALDLSRLAA